MSLAGPHSIFTFLPSSKLLFLMPLCPNSTPHHLKAQPFIFLPPIFNFQYLQFSLFYLQFSILHVSFFKYFMFLSSKPSVIQRNRIKTWSLTIEAFQFIYKYRIHYDSKQIACHIVITLTHKKSELHWNNINRETTSLQHQDPVSKYKHFQ